MSNQSKTGKPETNADRVETLKSKAAEVNERLAAAGIPMRLTVKQHHTKGWNGPEVRGYPTITVIAPGLDPAIGEELSELLGVAVRWGDSDRPKVAFSSTEPEFLSVEFHKDRQ